MNVSPGTRLGRYEVRARLGAGGMGEVYRAWDHDLELYDGGHIPPAEVGIPAFSHWLDETMGPVR